MLVAGFVAHVAVVWTLLDTGGWDWSVMGIPVVLAALAGAGAVGLGRTGSRWPARLMGGDLIHDCRQGHSGFTLTLPAV